jgi:hypothetical protein
MQGFEHYKEFITVNIIIETLCFAMSLITIIYDLQYRCFVQHHSYASNSVYSGALWKWGIRP